MLINKWLQSVSLFIVVSLIGLYLVRKPDTFTHLQHLRLSDFLFLLILRFLFLLVNGLILKAYASKFLIHLNHKEWIGLSFVTALGNYISPFSGGMLYRAGYLKLKHNLSLTKFTILLASNYMINFWCVAVTGLICALYLMAESVDIPWQIPFFFGGIVLFLFMLNSFSFPKFSSRYWILKKMEEGIEGLKELIRDRPLSFQIIFYIFLNIIVNGLSFYVAFRSIGFDIFFSQSLIISLIAVFSLLINITPANLGIQEVVVSLASSALKVGVGEGLVVALIIRAATMILVFTLGPVFLHTLSKIQSADST